MKAGKYTIKELFTNRYVEQIIIPEIQRDYVWGEKQVNGLLKSIFEDYQKFKDGISVEMQLEKEIQQAFEQFYKKQKFSCNIGFIYAYNDAEYVGKYFLIDGQQRLTTIYLLFLSFAKHNKDFNEVFKKTYTFETQPIVDYRVRESSHRFLKDLIKKYYKDINFINQSWNYNNYKNDITIQTIIANLKTIENFIEEKNLAEDTDFMDYIQNYIEFWYFDTNISEQGEELYIYLNARGEQMQANENEKAVLLGELKTAEEKNKWGKKWEDWQDFFWKNKGNNPNADKGFDNFLDCVKALAIFNKTDLTLIEIEKNYNALFRLFAVIKIYEFEWLKKCVEEIRDIFNASNTDWFTDYRDPNKGQEQNKMIFVWFILNLLSSEKENLTIECHIIRALRFIWVRYKNYNRAVQSISNWLNVWKSKQISEDIFDKEETIKYNFLHINDIIEEEFSENEMLIWQIEDHPLNINGRDLGAVNISHLIDFSINPDLQSIYKNFYELFPTKDCDIKYEKQLKSLLLHYKDNEKNPFWHRVTPWYYENYDCSDWRRIIRKTVFKDVFKFIFDEHNQCIINDLLQEKKKKFYAEFANIDEIKNNDLSKRRQIIVYSDLIDDIWECGNIAFYGNLPENEPRIFNNEMRIYKARRYYDGSKELWEEIKNKDKDAELKQILTKYKE